MRIFRHSPIPGGPSHRMQIRTHRRLEPSHAGDDEHARGRLVQELTAQVADALVKPRSNTALIAPSMPSGTTITINPAYSSNTHRCGLALC